MSTSLILKLKIDINEPAGWVTSLYIDEEEKWIGILRGEDGEIFVFPELRSSKASMIEAVKEEIQTVLRYQIAQALDNGGAIKEKEDE